MQLLCQTRKCGEYTAGCNWSTAWVIAKWKARSECVCVCFCVSFRGRVGRGGFSLWMTMQSVITSLRWWECRHPHVFLCCYGSFSHLPVSESSNLVSQDKEPLRSIPLRDIQKVHECLVKSGWVRREWLNRPPCCLVPTIALAEACVWNGRWRRRKCDYTQLRNKKCVCKLCARWREVW